MSVSFNTATFLARKEHHADSRFNVDCVIFIDTRFDAIFELSGTKNTFFRDLFSVMIFIMLHFGGARSVMVIVVGNGHGDTSSNPEPG